MVGQPHLAMTSTLESPADRARHRALADAESDGFAALGLSPRLVDALAKARHHPPFPIQAATLPDSLAGQVTCWAAAAPAPARRTPSPRPSSRASRPGRASVKPGRPRALVLAPTRELASQIEAAGTARRRALGLRTLTVFGGVGANPQIAALRNGRRHRHRLPGPARTTTCSSGHATSTRSRSRCSTRPTTWPTSASCRSYAGCSTRLPRAGSACCSRRRWTAASTSWSSGSCTTR